MQTRFSTLAMSVRLSNACIVTKRKKDLSRFLYHTKDHLAQFSERKNDWWGPNSSRFTWNFGSTGPSWSEIADFESIFARSASAVTSSEKVQLTLLTSPLRAFQWAQDDHRTLPLSPQWGSKIQNGRFRRKIALRLKKVCYKVSLCENC